MTQIIRDQIHITTGRLVLFIMVILLSNCQSPRGPRYDIHEPRSLSKDEIKTVRKIPDTHKAFMARFLPEIHRANNNVLAQRNAIFGLLDSLEKYSLGSPGYFVRLNTLLSAYRIDTVDPDTIDDPRKLEDVFTQLLHRADIIPVQLVMAQAIIESGWGRSGFAREGNNYFGMRCYSADCGVSPSALDSSGFYVKVYPSEMDGIEDYIWTLNTGNAYRNFRQMRAQMRAEESPLDPVRLAGGLRKYSENGDDYIKMVSNIIRNYIPHNVDALLSGRNKDEKARL